MKEIWPGLLEAWLVLTSVKYHGNLYILIPLNQRLALTSLRATGPCSPYLDLLKSKNSFISSVYIFDGLYYRPRRGSASKQQGEKSSLITIYFRRQVYIIFQTVPVCNRYAQINLLSDKEKTDRTKEPNSYSTMGSSHREIKLSFVGGFPLDSLAKSGFPLLRVIFCKI